MSNICPKCGTAGLEITVQQGRYRNRVFVEGWFDGNIKVDRQTKKGYFVSSGEGSHILHGATICLQSRLANGFIGPEVNGNVQQEYRELEDTFNRR